LIAIALCATFVLGATGAAADDEKAASPKATQAPATGGQVSGTVMSQARQPLRGVSVALIPAGGGALYGTSTGEGGRYALRDLGSGTYSVLVMDPGGSILRKERVNVRPLFRNLVDFLTEPAGSPRPHIPNLPPPEGGASATLDLTGSLITVDGAPIPEAWLIVAPTGAEAPSLRARTDAEGRFRLLRVPAGSYRITARALGHVTWSLGPLPLEAGKDVGLRLTLLPFPLGHPENPEDLLVPVEPVPPETFEKEP